MVSSVSCSSSRSPGCAGRADRLSIVHTIRRRPTADGRRTIAAGDRRPSAALHPPAETSPPIAVPSIVALTSVVQGARIAHNEHVQVDSVLQRTVREVGSWEGVSIHDEGWIVVLRRGRRELGHLHGDRLADLPFPVRIREQLVAAGMAGLHYVHPETGWVSHYIRGPQDAARVIDLFRLNYDRPWLAAGADWRLTPAIETR